jgi:23S rRNA (guanosine2251-2'-O)-methyltransferase
VSNASAGAVEHLAVAQVVNLNRLIEELKERNIWVAGLDSEPSTPPLGSARLDGGLAVVVGSEGEGLSRLTRERCDFLVRLPMLGQIGSLNAAVAGSIVLYAARQARQRD